MKESIMKKLIVVAAVLCMALVGGRAVAADDGPVKVVYHLSEGTVQASNALRNIRNHLDADPKAKIQVVTHGRGIDFLLKGAKDDKGTVYQSSIEELSLAGVEFKVCKNTLDTRKLDSSSVIQDAKIVKSGVAEVGRLQAKEGYVYLRP